MKIVEMIFNDDSINYYINSKLSFTLRIIGRLRGLASEHVGLNAGEGGCEVAGGALVFVVHVLYSDVPLFRSH